MSLSRKMSPLLSAAHHLAYFPAPSNITVGWNMGSLLGLCLTVQIASGLFLAMHYCPSAEGAFLSVARISSDTNYGWLIRGVHANGASLFFFCIYIHLARGLYFKSWGLSEVWLSGVTLLLLLMGVSFLGYVLPWGQMSFWGATVITNLISAVPYLGETIVYWLWGGFSVSSDTLNRFFVLHFLLPFGMAGVVGAHLISLHSTGSSSPLGVSPDFDKIPFHPYFTVKDLAGYFVVVGVWGTLVLLAPWDLGDPENFLEANPLITPIHIKPEWYFLFAYAILRSIPNKLGGVIGLVAAVMVLYVFPLVPPNHLSSPNSPLSKLIFWWFLGVFVILTWVGGNPVEPPFIGVGQLTSAAYFVLLGALLLV